MATKISLELTDDLYQQVRDFARLHEQPIEVAISTILEERLLADTVEDETIDWSEPDPDVEREMEAFITLHPSLKEQYMGQHVAIYHGQLIDHDQDFAALYGRIDKAYPEEFVWMATVEDEPLPTFRHLSPRFVRGS
jgi:hypothetical protein